MAYQTLYRKWRPTTFDEVIGQNHITSTLKNEIINNKTAHAYIFTGTRGTGKTSTAKILSRALNCENPQNGNPCNICTSCKGILDETVLDVVEMDAASNNGVENIREIIDQVRYSTANSKYKVYIIDEVHMLSTGAFNALLKTLEEPPAHVIFILATTEIHKVPATILSRCQRFDFKNITTEQIAGAVSNILTKEGINIENDATEYIAYLGNGSMRDALSITEQCLAYKSNNITYADITEILGTLDDAFLYLASEYIASGNIKELLLLFNKCMDEGKNADSFLEGMLKTLRDILLYQMAPEICDFTERKRGFVENVSKLYTKDKLVRCLDILSLALRDIKLSTNSRIFVECTFIRMSAPQYENNLSALLDRISAIESKIEKGNFAPETKKTPVEQPIAPKETKAPVIEKAPAYNVQHVPEEPLSKAPTQSATGVENVVQRWDEVKRVLEEKGRLVSFVSLYGVVPKADGNTLVLSFETKDAANKFFAGTAKADLSDAVGELFGLNPDIKCVYGEKIDENSNASNEIFDNLAKISTNYPENFKID